MALAFAIFFPFVCVLCGKAEFRAVSVCLLQVMSKDFYRDEEPGLEQRVSVGRGETSWAAVNYR